VFTKQRLTTLRSNGVIQRLGADECYGPKAHERESLISVFPKREIRIGDCKKGDMGRSQNGWGDVTKAKRQKIFKKFQTTKNF
jgi:hypothetical protein